MKLSFLLTVLSALIIVITNSCSKSIYSSTDQTVGLVNKTIQFTGYSTGYVMGDTLLTPGDTTHTVYALYFYQAISDTSFLV